MKIKKISLATALVATLGLTACGDDSSASTAPNKDDNTIIVGDDNSPATPSSSASSMKDKSSSSVKTDNSGNTNIMDDDFDFEDMSREDIMKLLDEADQDKLNETLEQMGMTKEEFVDYIMSFASIFDEDEGGEGETDVTCTGSENDDTWAMTVNAELGPYKMSTTSTSTFYNGTVTVSNQITMDYLTEKMCKDAAAEMEEEAEGAYEMSVGCEGSILTYKETAEPEECSAEERKEAYKEFQESCEAAKNGNFNYGDDEDEIDSYFTLKKKSAKQPTKKQLALKAIKKLLAPKAK